MNIAADLVHYYVIEVGKYSEVCSASQLYRQLTDTVREGKPVGACLRNTGTLSRESQNAM